MHQTPKDSVGRGKNDQAVLRTAGTWLAAASILLVLTLIFHGPLAPNLEVQMTRIAESASRWAVVHWMASVSLSCFAVASLLVLISGSRLTSTVGLISAWAAVLVGALWTLTTAVTEVTVIADLAGAGDLAQFEAWWSFAEGHGNGFSALAVAVSVIAWNQAKESRRIVPRWSASVGAGAGLASFAGWSLGVWFDVGPANLVWVLASGVMCLWLSWFGVAVVRTGAPKA